MSLLELLVDTEYDTSVCLIWDDLQPSPVMWTYSYLKKIATSLACCLRSLLSGCYGNSNTGRPFLIGLYAHNCPNTTAAILSILAIPAAYCPLSTSSPSEWVWSTIKNSGIRNILIEISLIDDFLAQDWVMTKCTTLSIELLQYGFLLMSLDSLPFQQTQSEGCSSISLCSRCYELVPCYQSVNQLLISKPLKDLGLQKKEHTLSLCQCVSAPTGLAYLVHTTGTTGLPKQVWVPHCCIVPNIVDLRMRFKLTHNDRVLNAAPLTFDPSVVEIFMALSTGACLVIVPEIVKISSRLFSWIILSRHQITILQATPSLVRQLPREVINDQILGAWSSIRILAFGGEMCPQLNTLKQWKSPENTTRIFNIYGITEVSSWATCQELSLDHTHQNDVMVAIGDPLLGTDIELRDDEGSVVKGQGSGTVYLGGSSRVCCLGNEPYLVPGTLRNSRDIGYCNENGQVYIMGRTDRQIKRRGHRINLDLIEQIFTESVLIKSCHVIYIDEPHPPQLIAIVVPAITILPDRFKEQVLQEINTLLPSTQIPDHLMCVEELPLNSHGKLNVRAVQSLLTKRHSPLKDKIKDVRDWQDLVIQCISVINGDNIVRNDIKLLDQGLTSFDIVRMMNLLQEKQAILEDSMVTAIFELFLTEFLFDAIYKSYDILKSGDVIGCYGNVVGVKRALEDEDIPQSKKLITSENDIIWCQRGLTSIYGRLHPFILNPSNIGDDISVLGLKEKWVVPIGGCVDSSPLVVKDNSSHCIYIGSHSGQVIAIETSNGTIKWRTQLQDRIESSPCLSNCGQYVAIGCYDGCLYVLKTISGSLHWCYTTSGYSIKDPIKSTPIAHYNTGDIWFGSHDGHLYAVNISLKQTVYQIHLGSGPCFSSTSFSQDGSIAVTATLKGRIVAVSVDNGKEAWSYLCQKPIFSSPCVLPDNTIACGCVNGSLYILSDKGELITTLQTNGPIFTSCVVAVTTPTSNEFVLFCGSHDNHMYSWNVIKRDYTLKWKTQLNSEVYSIPSLGHVTTDDVLCVCTSKGTIYLIHATSGYILVQGELPSNIFSSPVVIHNYVIVGCRNNNIYCIEITT